MSQVERDVIPVNSLDTLRQIPDVLACLWPNSLLLYRRPDDRRYRLGVGRYDTPARTLPGRIAQAQALEPVELSATAVADLYSIATRLCIKLGEDGLVAITSDRALNFARGGGMR
ncbi:hypothetical protein [Streptomyces sp. NPDC050355]|uniref:hypothetical protein n=1 Tax=Streptomyces sp. NPDC050355 TaxID=3365609 RepID=UPI0037B6C767